ncbi:MAG: aspartate--tRNA ligase [Desulfatiglandales bacterium]
MDWKKRIFCGELTEAHVGSVFTLMGWVDAIRDHGNLIFIHLRDRSGILQVVFDPLYRRKAHWIASELRQEYVVEVEGILRRRFEGTENPHLATGNLELLAHRIKILSRSKVLPFQISEKAMVYGEGLKANPDNVEEELRLRYRYLDLRRPSKQELFIKRHKIVQKIREVLNNKGFLELETPILTKSTPEGARDFLVPSRLQRGKFYALPQSPQLFKQLFMVSGFERYYQIAKCFRDEDLKVNRQPEFTQLDIEASFVEEEFFFQLIEEILWEAFLIGGVELKRPFKRLPFRDAMELYGSDKPDLRFGMEFRDATDILRGTSYEILRKVLDRGGTVKGFVLRGMASELSKNLLQNEYALRIVPLLGGKGMTWMKYVGGALQSNIVQFFRPSELEALIGKFEMRDGDVLLLIGDEKRESVNEVLGRLRLHLAQRLKLKPEAQFMPLWVTEFPMFELKEDGLSCYHHPFTMPERNDFDPKDTLELLALKSRAYDVVINGEELGGGSIRIHDPELQRKVFEALGFSEEEVKKKFGFFVEAFEYGPPPHGGIALGLDRTVGMILGVESIREVIAFPKNRSGICPLSQAPSTVEPEQLAELGISLQEGLTEALEVASSGESEAVDKESVLHVARLSRLLIEDSEVESYVKELGSIIGYMRMLNQLPTEGVPLTSHVIPMVNVFREDIPREMEEKELVSRAVIQNAPEVEGDFFKVPKILEG